MRYLLDATRQFFENTTPDGPTIWSRARDNTVTVLTVPSAWGPRERDILRKSAMQAGLVPEGGPVDLLQFVTQAEASLHYALFNRTAAWLEVDSTFAVMDAGGFTIDTGVYKCTSTGPIELEEVCVGDCAQV